ncbi:MAG: type IV pilus modification PilV family protein [Planctomycetota bacterium]|jgi:hypothetical protein
MSYRKQHKYCRRAFSLVEATTSLIILAFISSSVLVVINRCVAATADSTLRMQAFEVARENMEMLLALDSVEEMVEYGYSEKYPEIQWQTTVESFSAPSPDFSKPTTLGWVRALCSAEYVDVDGEQQKVEMVHWLTNLTQKQMEQVAEEKRLEEEMLALMTEQERAIWEEQKRREIQPVEPSPGPEPGPGPGPEPPTGPNPYPTNPKEFREFIRDLMKNF